MKKFLTITIMTVLTMSFLSGCADQANAPAITGNSTTLEDVITEDSTPPTNLAATTEETAAAANAGAAAGEEASEESASTEPQEGDAGDTTEITSQEEQPFDQLAAPASGEKIAVIETDLGTIKFKLFPDLAPEISKNFEELANSGKFNGVPFHRVVKDFMIQTGDFTNMNGTGGYSYKGPDTMLEDEITPALKHLYGTVSMANRGPDTNGSQFFIVTNQQGTSFLDGGYSVFGQVFEGMDVALEIANLQVPGTEKPSEPVLMNKVEVVTM